MTTKTGNDALKLPLSIKEAAEKLVKEKGVSLNQFILAAAAKEVGAADAIKRRMQERRERADVDALLRLLNREGGEPPREGDELPEGWTDEDKRRLLEGGPLRLTDR